MAVRAPALSHFTSGSNEASPIRGEPYARGQLAVARHLRQTLSGIEVEESDPLLVVALVFIVRRTMLAYSENRAEQA